MNDWLKITAIDVGKGDCILLQRGDHAVLIDTGYEDTAGKVLGELGSAGVKKLEALILTHFHKDHIGGVSAVLKSFGACRIYMPDFVKDSEHFYTLVRTAEDLNTEIIRVVSDRRTDFFGAQIRMFPSPFVYDGTNENDCSMVCALSFGRVSFLFAADLQKDGIAAFLKDREEHFDVLKVPHHGNKKEGMAELLAAVKPSVAVITDSAAKPADDSVLEMLRACGAAVFRTSVQGSIAIECGPDSMDVIRKDRNG